MKNKSFSPRAKVSIKSPKISLKKLTSLKQLSPAKPNDSVFSFNSPDSHSSMINSQINSKVFSSSRISLKLSNSNSQTFLSHSTQHKLRSIAHKYSPVKSAKSIQMNIDEHLLPLSSEETISTFENILSKYELIEILKYTYIYYLGLKAKKTKPLTGKYNLGYDNKDTDYILVPGDHIAYQYEIIEILGSGSFSQVCKCWDHKNKKETAIKIIKSHKRFLNQGQVELKVLAYLLSNDKNIDSHFAKMTEYFNFRNHLCIVFELLSFNLFELLKANKFKGFSNTLLRRFTLQILNALSFLKKNQIIHCDLKPENIILINPKESLIKIIDFGSACFEDEKIYYYVQSRIYRAPEIILGINYTTAIDMWSLGCIVFELYTGSPLFLGENETDQLFAIMEVLGTPPESILDIASKRNNFFYANGNCKNFANSKGKIGIPGTKSLAERIMTNDQLLINFINSNNYLGCLEWIPEKRITPDEALEHPWIQQLKKIQPIIHKPIKSPRLKIN